jgi:hypothetical protein
LIDLANGSAVATTRTDARSPPVDACRGRPRDTGAGLGAFSDAETGLPGRMGEPARHLAQHRRQAGTVHRAPPALHQGRGQGVHHHLRAAGLDDQAVTAHVLRHTLATTLEMGGVASSASFGRSRERALPAPQRTGRQPGAVRRSRHQVADLGCQNAGCIRCRVETSRSAANGWRLHERFRIGRTGMGSCATNWISGPAQVPVERQSHEDRHQVRPPEHIAHRASGGRDRHTAGRRSARSLARRPLPDIPPAAPTPPSIAQFTRAAPCGCGRQSRPSR